MTMLVVSWEEMWFRGLPINYMAKRLPALAVCAFASSIFVLMHGLNPSIVLWRAAPGLFLGGMCLSLSFFAFQSIWFPLGLHFAWNQFGDSLPLLFGVEFPDNRFWGENGIVPNFILLAFAAALINIVIKNTVRSNMRS